MAISIHPNNSIVSVLAKRNLQTKSIEVEVSAKGNSEFLHGNLVFVPIELGQISTSPTMVLNDDVAQHFFNELWMLGMRPSNIDTAGELKAKDAHLKDMRDIAFAFMKCHIGLQQ